MSAESMRAWRAANPEKARSGRVAWIAANADKLRKQQRAWAAENRARVNALARARRLRNIDESRKQSRESAQRRRAADPDKFRAHGRERYAKDRARTLWVIAKRRARKRGIEFTVDVADVVIPKVCPVFGTAFDLSGGKPHPASPSLDRVDPSLGYVPGNVWVISFRANVIKNDATPDELLQIAAAVSRRLGATR